MKDQIKSSLEKHAKLRQENKKSGKKVVYEISLKENVAQDLNISPDDVQFNDEYHSTLQEIVLNQLNKPGKDSN